MRTPTNAENDEIRKLLQSNINDLYQQVGLAQASSEGVFFSSTEAAERGKEFFNSLRGWLYEKVCVQWEFCSRKDDPKFADAVAFVVALSDAIVAQFGSVPSTLLAALVFKHGLANFCSCR